MEKNGIASMPLTQADASRHRSDVVARLRRAVAADPRDARAQRALGQALRGLGQAEAAAMAEMAAIRATAHDPAMIGIAEAMLANDLPRAEAALRERLRSQPRDVAAIRLMAELAARIGRLSDSEALLRRALDEGNWHILKSEHLRRLMARDGETREAAERMLAAQATREQRLAAADDVIDNGGDAADLPAQVAALDARYRQLAADS